MEKDLVKLLRWTDLRLRTTRSLAVACGALIATTGISAALLALFKLLLPGKLEGVYAWVSLPFGLIFFLTGWSFFHKKFSIKRTAAILDRQAGLAARISTWCSMHNEYVNRNPMHGAFIAALRQDVTATIKNVSLRESVPIKIPPWSRALWPVGFLLGFSLLLPERVPVLAANGKLGQIQPVAIFSQLVTGEADVQENEKKQNVEILSPKERRKYEWAVMMEDLPVNEREKMLRELEKRIGNLSESSLTEDVQRILKELRRQVADERMKSVDKANGNVAGAMGAESNSTGITDDFSEGSVAATERIRAALWAAAEKEFPDCATQLRRYQSKLIASKLEFQKEKN